MINSIHNLTTALMINNMNKGKRVDSITRERPMSKFDYIMSLDDWDGHEEEYGEEVIEYLNSTEMPEEEIHEILNAVKDKYDDYFTPGVCEWCYTVFDEGWICNDKPYCSEDCITRAISEDSWISLQEYEPDENGRKTFWG